MTTRNKHLELRDRIEAGERRNEERKELASIAREAKEGAVGFVKEHPVATVVGGIAVGIAVGALTSRGRKMGAKAGRRAGLLATALTELGMLYANRLMEKIGETATAGKDNLEDLGDNVSSAARTARREIGHRTGSAADAATTIGKRISRRTERTMREFRGRISK